MSDAEKVTYDFANAQQLTGTSSDRTTELIPGRWYAIFVATGPVRIMDGDSSVTAGTSDPCLPEGAILPYPLDNGATHIAAIHKDGSSSFEVHVVPASPGAGAA